MVHVNIGPRFTKVEIRRRPSMLDLALGATRLGLTEKAARLGGQALRLGAKGMASNPGLSARALSWATRGTPRWPWESGPSWSAPWQRRRSWLSRMPAGLGAAGSMMGRRGPTMRGRATSLPWPSRRGGMWPSGWSWPWERRSTPAWQRVPAAMGLAGATLTRQAPWQRGRMPNMPWQPRRGGMWPSSWSLTWQQPRQPLPWLKRRWVLLAGMALGALLMYFFDVDHGNRRRNMAVQRGSKLMRQAAQTAGNTGRRMSSELAGKRQALLRSRDHHEELDDATLAHKVESVLFRDPSVPKGDLNVNAEHGVVVIRGQVQDPTQMARIEQMVRGIDGVHEVHSLLHTAGSPAPNKPAF